MEKILISAGVFLSLAGVFLMIEANIIRHKNLGKMGNVGGVYDPAKYGWGMIFLIVGAISQVLGIWFVELCRIVSSSFAGAPIVKNLSEAGEISWFDKILDNLSLIIAGLALIATTFIAIASSKTARAAKHTMQSQLYLKLFEEYASEKMKDALEKLNEDQEYEEWKELAKEYPEGGTKFIEELKKLHISGLLNELSGQNARRYVKYYFIKALRLKKLKFLSEELLRQLGSVAGINLLYDVVQKLEEDTKAREEIEEIKRICDRYDEGSEKG